jgi:hypothetical protein
MLTKTVTYYLELDGVTYGLKIGPSGEPFTGWKYDDETVETSLEESWKPVRDPALQIKLYEALVKELIK